MSERSEFEDDREFIAQRIRLAKERIVQAPPENTTEAIEFVPDEDDDDFEIEMKLNS